MDDVMIRIMCPNLACRRILAVPGSARGKIVKCSGCSKLVRVPQAPVAPDDGEGGEGGPGAGAKPAPPDEAAA